MLDRAVSYFEPFALLVALVPMIGYLMLLGSIRLSGLALITTGGRDLAALAMAISGLIVVGPAELFFPTAAATAFGPLVWLILAVFYALCVTLVALASKPKLVIYGRTPEEIFPALVQAAEQLDADAVSNREQLQIHLPNAKVHLLAAGHHKLDYTQITTFEPMVSSAFWSQLLALLRGHVARTPKTSPRNGYGMLLMAVLLACLLFWQGFEKQTLVVEGFRNWLWR